MFRWKVRFESPLLSQSSDHLELSPITGTPDSAKPEVVNAQTYSMQTTKEREGKL